MKLIDYYVGIPVCFQLSLLARLKELLRPTQLPTSLRRILVMKFLGMGSIILATPTLRALRARFPEARITFLTFASNRTICEMLDLADEVITLRTDNLWVFARDLLQVLRRLRQQRFDCAINLEFFSKFASAVTYWSGAPRRVGYFTRQAWQHLSWEGKSQYNHFDEVTNLHLINGRSGLLTDEVCYNYYRHITEIFLSLAGAVGASVTDRSLTRPPVRLEDQHFVADLLAASGESGTGPRIVINVNAGELALERRWPAEHFVALASALKERYEALLVFVGAPEDEPYVTSVVEAMRDSRGVLNLAGQLNLRQLAALLERTDLFITNDSGPLHLAAALGTRTVSFFGPETPVLYGPQGAQHLIFFRDLYCSPCLNVFNVKTAMCHGNNQCLKQIPPAMVLQSMVAHYPELFGQTSGPLTGARDDG
jgi:ADP-heptose:LPS heptosyltransferase